MRDHSTIIDSEFSRTTSGKKAMIFISSSSDSESDETSETEFRLPAGLMVNVSRRRMVRRKCQKGSLNSSRKRNSPSKLQNSSPVKFIGRTQKSGEYKFPTIMKKSAYNLENHKTLMRDHSTKIDSEFSRTQTGKIKLSSKINAGSPLKFKKKSENEFIVKQQNIHKHRNCAASSEIEPSIKKRRHISSVGRLLGSSFSTVLNDYSNPFEDESDEEEKHTQLYKYKRRMRDLVDLYRYLNQHDVYGACRRPVYRPFLFRNLFYMRNQRPCELSIDTEGIDYFYEKHHQQSRTESRASDKIPTTVKFILIRNYNYFGHKTAIVQCYHVTELNGKFSQLKRIPSANFEKAVNERISSYIDIDMLDDCQISALDDRNSRAVHFVVRVLFRLEDAEIGGRHLRKIDSRQSGESSKYLRKNDAIEVVMFGSIRIFSYSPEQGLRVLTGETSILLSSTTELGFDDLNTKSSVSQVTKLLNFCCNRSDKGCVPFIRVIVLNEEEEEAEVEKTEFEKQKCSIRDSSISTMSVDCKRRSLDRMVNGLLKMEMDVAASITSSSLSTNEGRKTLNTTNNRKQMLKYLFELPEKIALKFLFDSNVSLSINSSLSMQGFSNSSLKEYETSEIFAKSSCTLPKMHFSDSSVTEDQLGIDNSSSDESSSIANDSKISVKDSPVLFVLRVLSVNSPCFFCNAKLRLHNLWTLYKHFKFMHPRFTFNYESSILVADNFTLPGFSISLNIHFDTIGLNPLQNKFQHVCASNNGINSLQKRLFDNRSVWLVTRGLAKMIRENIDFPIERFTAISHAQCNEFEFLRSVGRFDFDVPTKVDQRWLIQSGSRKLEDITDLHPAERNMMQVWNAFLPGVHITMLARKMTYKAARVFVNYHWRKIEHLKLRTHFLLLLSTLLNVNVIDEEERYDLLMRLDPNYMIYDDSKHFVTRELTLLEKERRNNQRGLNDGTGHFVSMNDTEIKQQNPKKETKEDRKYRQTFSGQLPSLPLIEFNSLLELRNRYPFASCKRLGNIWKFIRPYDLNDFSLRISQSTTKM